MKQTIKRLLIVLISVLIIATPTHNCHSKTKLKEENGIVRLKRRKIRIYGGKINQDMIKEIQFVKTGYIINHCMFREKPKKNGRLVKRIVNLNTKIKYADYNDKYKIVQGGKNKVFFIHSKNISNKPIKTTSFDVTGDKCKTYESYTAIGTSGRSTQSKLQSKATTREDGVRVVDNRVCIAIGSRYKTKIGQYVDVQLENGYTINCIVGDWKANCHTINNHSMGYNKDTIEVIVDTKVLKRSSKVSGDMSDLCKSWKSHVEKIVTYEKYYFK